MAFNFDKIQILWILTFLVFAKCSEFKVFKEFKKFKVFKEFKVFKKFIIIIIIIINIILCRLYITNEQWNTSNDNKTVQTAVGVFFAMYCNQQENTTKRSKCTTKHNETQQAGTKGTAPIRTVSLWPNSTPGPFVSFQNATNWWSREGLCSISLWFFNGTTHCS